MAVQMMRKSFIYISLEKYCDLNKLLLFVGYLRYIGPIVGLFVYHPIKMRISY